MKELQDLYINDLQISVKAQKHVNDAHNLITEAFDRVENIEEYHQGNIIRCMKQCQISERHFNPSTGYGYGDDGRDTLEKLYAMIFGAEDALVRPQWGSGTHVISDALFSLLRPGDAFISAVGQPYDTLNDIIQSLKEWGIEYNEVELTSEGSVNLQGILECIKNNKNIKLVLIQRSRGYSWRQSLSIDEIEKIIKAVKKQNPNIYIMVDNCYGEFTEYMEPCHIGADLCVGSLIKNPGGGLAPTGCYAVGTKEAIEKLSFRLTAAGIGREVGSYAAGYRAFYQGLFMAPHIVGEAIKGAILTAKLFEDLGYEVLPKWDEQRSDIIQSIKFNDDKALIEFCQGIQWASPVDGHVVPYPWDMPGYEHQVIMAAGTFVQGASIELSADAPIREPYIAYLQGGLTYSHVKLALMVVITRLAEKGYIVI